MLLNLVLRNKLYVKAKSHHNHRHGSYRNHSQDITIVLAIVCKAFYVLIPKNKDYIQCD